jgi:hypothetical protein
MLAKALNKAKESAQTIHDKLPENLKDSARKLHDKLPENLKDRSRKLTDRLLHNEYQVKPFDLVLFKGDDAVGKLIQSIEEAHVNAADQTVTKWTHVGIIVDSTVLPLPYMQPNKPYLYESVFSGTILGYQYSTVQPVDHPFTEEKKYHSGPQIRPFYESVLDTAGMIAISPMTPTQRAKIDAMDIQVLQRTMLDFHAKYFDYGYPFSIVPQIASANDGLFQLMTKFKNTLSLYFALTQSKKAS